MFQPTQEQRWDPVEGFRPALSSAAASRELRRWTVLALGALAIAGIYALLLAISRIPGADTLFPWPVAFYEKSLIIHVVFSFVVWYLAIGIILMLIGAYRLSDSAPKLRSLGASALAAMTIAFVMLAVPALMDRGQPSLNNYVPAIIDPVYYIGLLMVAFAITLAAVRIIANALMRSGPLEPIGAAGLSCAVIALLAVAAFAVSWNRLGIMPAIAAENEDLFWAGGHILQFFNTSLMIAGWVLLGGRALGRPPVTPRLVMGAFGFNAVLALGGFALMFIEAPFSAEERVLFTHYQYALAPVPIFVGLIAGVNLLRAPKPEGDARRTARLALALSLVVFFAGGVLGIFVDGTDTRTPAHYHGVIGGVNVAAMGLIILFVLPLLERGLLRWKTIRASFWLYGLGQLLHSLGLFIAGGYGAPRKVSDTAPGMDVIGNWIGHVGIGIGGVIAVIGGIMFIWIAAKRVLARAP
ncbi:cbb3-type cytochrome c oxidase subunit I [Thalassospiraceae bacterium LMO-JJ14]|nr:cbb3-type cytochrome c oxidase subunit I [Thalassospiraceae bacterium LMO-JJ14]